MSSYFSVDIRIIFFFFHFVYTFIAIIYSGNWKPEQGKLLYVDWSIALIFNFPLVGEMVRSKHDFSPCSNTHTHKHSHTEAPYNESILCNRCMWNERMTLRRFNTFGCDLMLWCVRCNRMCSFRNRWYPRLECIHIRERREKKK